MTSKLTLLMAIVVALGVGAVLFLLDGGEAAPAQPSPVDVSRQESPAPTSPLPEPAERSRSAQPAPVQLRPQEALATAPEPGGTLVTGRVVDAAGNPKDGARLVALDASRAGLFAAPSGPLGFSAVSDGEGRFALPGLPADAPVSLEARHDDFAPTLVGPFRLAADSQRDVGDIVMRAGTRVTGTVTSSTRGPLPGATVVLNDSSRVGDEPAGQAVTGAGGHYVIEHLAARQFNVLVSAPEHAPTTGLISFVLGSPGAEWTQDFVLDEAVSSLGGEVRDELDQPVPDVSLRLMRRGSGGGTTYFTAETRSGPGGRFLFEPVPGGRFDLTVTSDQVYMNGSRAVESARLDHVVYVRRGLDIRGTVIAPAGAPPARFTVRIQPDAQAGGGVIGEAGLVRRIEGASPPGTFLIAGLRPGTYRLEVIAKGWAPTTSGDVVLGPDSVGTEVVVRLNAGGRISGRLQPAVAEAAIELRPAEWDPTLGIEHTFPTAPLAGIGARSEETGAFTVTGVPAGTYVVTARPPGAPPVHVREVEVYEGRETSLGVLEVEPGCQVTGIVLGPDGRPRPGAQVSVRSDAFASVGRAGHDGSFELGQLPPGFYTVVAVPASIAEALRFEARVELEVTPEGPNVAELLLGERILRDS